jgi:dTDP-4-dehydrorhamnose reductase
MNIITLGSTGMLGSVVAGYLSKQPGCNATATTRATLDAESASADSLSRLLEGKQWAVNCIGVIKPYIHDNNPAEVERATRVNALFPHLLAKAAEKTGCRVLQIATDCVYSGQKGRYGEPDKHDALDVYGKTKSIGEVYSSHVHHLRCSIIGPEPKAHVSLLDWFLGQPKGAKVNGFTNHLWNGVTTLAYAKLCAGIIRNNISLPHLVHVVPTGTITKSDLLLAFRANYKREDITVNPTQATVVIDRTLSTTQSDLNEQLWSAAGYAQPPTVAEMVAEMASQATTDQ